MRLNKFLKLIIVAFALFAVGFIILKFNVWRSQTKDEKPVVCTADAKICSDGSYVSRIPPKCDFALCSKEDVIQVETPKANNIITSPLIIQGKARGFWFFEANFPIKLYDDNGNLLTTSVAQAQGDWMTEGFVPFSAELKFENSKTEKGTLVLEKNNPSGLPEYADEIRIPVLFANETKKIKLYYYNPELDKDESGNVMCSPNGLVAVDRQMVKGAGFEPVSS